MRVTIHFMGQARLAANRERATVNVEPGCSPSAAVAQAAAEAGGPLQAFLFHPGGQPRRSILLIVGTRQVGWDSADPLRDGDCITVLPPIAGGAVS